MQFHSNISVLGCGWLGLPLSILLIKEGYSVKGSSTQDKKILRLKGEGIEAFLLKLAPEPQGQHWEHFLNSHTLLINIPPQTRRLGYDFHPQQIKNLLALIKHSPIKRIIYISSTSVYPNVDREVDEQEPINMQNTTNPALLEAEHLIRNEFNGDWLILRLGGLLGYERIPGKYFAGKKNLQTGKIPVNYLHLDDAIQIIHQFILRTDLKQEVFNIVSPEHPVKEVIYKKNVADFGFDAPTFEDIEPKNYKIVLINHLLNTINYTFKYPNPLDYRYEIQRTT